MNSSAMTSPTTSTRRLEKPSTSASRRSRRSASPGRGWMLRAINIADCALRQAQGGLRLSSLDVARDDPEALEGSKAGLRAGLRLGVTVLAASATLVAQAPRPQPGVRLGLPQIESQMFHVSAG